MIPINISHIILSTTVVIYNILVNLLPRRVHANIYVPLNIFFLAIITFWAFAFYNLSLDELGLKSTLITTGIFWGVVIGIAASLPSLFAMAFPRVGANTREEFFEDLKPISVILYRSTIHIPIGTAFFEEALFRGILFTVLEVNYGLTAAILVSSGLFAVWHIIPTFKLQKHGQLLGFESRKISQLKLHPVIFILIYAGQMLALFAAGVVLALIRSFTGGLIA
ncbi:hypothetical protein A2165_02430, partial [Candidatus Curtissbacteria bacterium RBG_13_40_7]